MNFSENSEKSLTENLLIEKESFTLNELANFLNVDVNDLPIFSCCMLYKGGVSVDENDKYLSIPNTVESWQNIAKGLYRFSEIKADEIPTKELSYKNIADEYYVNVKEGGYVDERINLVNKFIKIYQNVSLTMTAMLGKISFDEAVKMLKNINSPYYFNSKTKSQNLGFVYIAKQTNESNLYKIGCTNNIESRLKTFKVGNCFVEIIASKQVEDKYYYENFFHKYFNQKQFKNEWYKLT